MVADRDIGRGARRRGAVVDAGERRLDGRLGGRRARRRRLGRRVGDGGRGATGGAASTAGAATATGAAMADGARRMIVVPPLLTSSSPRSPRSRTALRRSIRASSEASALDSETAGSGVPVAAVHGRRLDDARGRGRVVVAVGAGLAGSHGDRAPRARARSATPVSDMGCSSSRGVSGPVIRPTGGRRARCSGRRTRTSSRARRGRRDGWPRWASGRGPAACSSGSSRLIVGGMQPSRIARIVAIASIAPAAPSVWPSIDLLAEIATFGRVVAEDRADRLQLALVALRRGRGVGVDVLDLGRVEARLVERAPRRPDRPDAARRRQRDVRGVRRRAVAHELGERRRAARLGVLDAPRGSPPRRPRP